MNPGCVVEYLQGKELSLAFCLSGENKGKLQVLSVSGRTESLPAKKVLFVHPSRLSEGSPREEVIDLLASLESRRKEQAESLDLEELWELLVDEGPERDWTLEELGELVFEEALSEESRALVYRALVDDRLYFVRRPEGFRARPREQVEETLLRQRVEAQREAEREVVLAWMESIWHRRGTEVAEEHRALIEEWTNRIQDAAALGEGSSHSQHVARLFKALEVKAKDAAFQFMVRLGRWSADENLDLYSNKTPLEFPDEVLEEAERAASLLPQVLAEPDRWDLTDRPAYSVDDAHTTEIDDAVSFERTAEGFELAVHIADAASFLRPEFEALERETALRCTSIYLPDLKVRMVPEVLSDGAMSLVAGENRPAFTCRAWLSADGTLLRSELGPSVIRVNQRLDYETVDRYIEDGDQEWAALAELAGRLKQGREEAGAVMLPFLRKDVSVVDGKVVLTSDDRDTPSQLIVSELMILVNRCVADYLAGNSLPAVYRCQKPPEPALEKRPEWKPHHLYEARKSFSRSYQSLDPEPHSGLGLARYVQASSPIRRIRDLLHQRQVLHHLRTGEALYDRETMEGLMHQTQLPISQAEKMERNRKWYFLHKYLKGHLGQEVGATVLATSADKYVLSLDDTYREVDVPQGSGSLKAPGDRVKVKVISVYPRDGVVKVSSPLEERAELTP